MVIIMHSIRFLQILLCAVVVGCSASQPERRLEYASPGNALQLGKSYLVRSYGVSLDDSDLSGRVVLRESPACAEPFWVMIYNLPQPAKFLKGYYVIMHKRSEVIHDAGEITYSGSYLSRLIEKVPSCAALKPAA